MGINIEEYIEWKKNLPRNSNIEPCLYNFLIHKNRVDAAKIMHTQRQEQKTIEQQIRVMQT